MKKALGLGVILVFATSSNISIAEETLPPASVVEAQAIHTEQNKEVTKLLKDSKFVQFNVVFPSDWDPDHLHWDIPSSVIVYSDGSTYAFAHHLANMRRTGGIFDTGNYQTFLVNLTLFEKWIPATKSCGGAALISKDFVLRGLDYKQEVWDVSANGQLAPPDILAKGECLTTTRWIR